MGWGARQLRAKWLEEGGRAATIPAATLTAARLAASGHALAALPAHLLAFVTPCSLSSSSRGLAVRQLAGCRAAAAALLDAAQWIAACRRTCWVLLAPAPARPRLQVWLRAVRYRLASGDGEAARKTLDRSLQSLPKFEHVRMVSQTGLLEFKLGDPGQQGRRPPLTCPALPARLDGRMPPLVAAP